MLVGNAFDDFKIKPMLIHTAENPQAFKNCSKDSLPVIYKSNKNASITGFLFSHWPTDYVVTASKKYCEQENSSFKILLLVHNTPLHPIFFKWIRWKWQSYFHSTKYNSFNVINGLGSDYSIQSILFKSHSSTMNWGNR